MRLIADEIAFNNQATVVMPDLFSAGKSFAAYLRSKEIKGVEDLDQSSYNKLVDEWMEAEVDREAVFDDLVRTLQYCRVDMSPSKWPSIELEEQELQEGLDDDEDAKRDFVDWSISPEASDISTSSPSRVTSAAMKAKGEGEGEGCRLTLLGVGLGGGVALEAAADLRHIAYLSLRSCIENDLGAEMKQPSTAAPASKELLAATKKFLGEYSYLTVKADPSWDPNAETTQEYSEFGKAAIILSLSYVAEIQPCIHTHITMLSTLHYTTLHSPVSQCLFNY